MLHIQRYLLNIILFSVLLLVGGCSSSINMASGTSGEKISKNLQAALDAIANNNDEQALESFDRMAKRKEVFPPEHRFTYANRLYQAERYADAVEQYTAVIADTDHTFPDYMPAHRQREEARQQLELQQQEAARLATLAATAKTVAEEVNDSWQLMSQQALARQPHLTEPVTGMEFILVQGGCFEMGDHFGDGEADELPLHQVCVDDFYLGKFEVTQAQWVRLMGYNPSQNQASARHPVEMVSWQEAMDFAGRLSGGLGKYRLPTEAEWEYAARSGGKIEKYSGSDQLDEVGWHEDNADSSQPVGLKKPNGLGFYDMSGNVYERCLDYYAAEYYSNSPINNPKNLSSGERRVIRGGSWDSRPSYSRTSFRIDEDRVNSRQKQTGFRLALPVPEGQ